MTDCPVLLNERLEILGPETPGSDMRWSVRSLLEFSYIKRVNEAFEGNDQTEVHENTTRHPADPLDVSLGFDRLSESIREDENNNGPSVVTQTAIRD